MRRFSDTLGIGRLVKPQGRKGELLVDPTTDRPERFASLQAVLVEEPDGGCREMQVEDCWPHKGRFVVKLRGVDSIDAAERLRGRGLGIPPEELEPLPRGSYYHHDLVGLRVQDAAGRPLGRVERLLDTGAVPVLQIAGPEGELLLPLAEDFVTSVDLAAGLMTVLVPESVEAR